MKKNGCVKSGAEVKKLFDDLDKRQDLVQMFKDSFLDKDSVCCFCWVRHVTVLEISKNPQGQLNTLSST